MGLDIYVGALSRYYSGNWETIIQQSSHDLEMEVQLVRANDPPYTLPDQDEIRNEVVNWRRNLSNNLRGRISVQLDWDEAMSSPYFTDKPTWDSYWGLLLWAAYTEHPELKMPSYIPDDLSPDVAYQSSIDEKFQCQYSQLLHGCELWLPCDFNFTFPAKIFSGNNITIGSTKGLLSQLEKLNLSTWKADESTLKDWLEVAAARGALLETHARFAFSVFHTLAKLSVAHNLPMKLDY